MSNRWPDKIIIGLTGNIATGKSAVLDMAAERGAMTVDADKVVHQLLNNDLGVQDAVEIAFGPDVRRVDGTIDREKLGTLVFDDTQELAILESILHPAVSRSLLELIDGSEAQIVFIEAIKLLESSLADECDQVWVTSCPPEIQTRRLMTYRGMDEETAVVRVKAQPPQKEKVAAADVVIDTSGSLEYTETYFDIAWQRLLMNVAGPFEPRTSLPETSSHPSRPALANHYDALTFEPEVTSEDAQQEQAGQDPMFGQEPEVVGPDSTETKTESLVNDGVSVRRARPSDIPEILWLIRRATGGAVRTKREDLLFSLGDRGYLIGESGGSITSIIGWSSENLIAIIDQIVVNPPEAAESVGVVMLEEIENTANTLICEVMLAFPAEDGPEEVRQLLSSRGFVEVSPASLPKAWQAAVTESRPEGSSVWMKILRDTRAMPPS